MRLRRERLSLSPHAEGEAVPSIGIHVGSALSCQIANVRRLQALLDLNLVLRLVFWVYWRRGGGEGGNLSIMTGGFPARRGNYLHLVSVVGAHSHSTLHNQSHTLRFNNRPLPLPFSLLSRRLLMDWPISWR